MMDTETLGIGFISHYYSIDLHIKIQQKWLKRSDFYVTITLAKG